LQQGIRFWEFSIRFGTVRFFGDRVGGHFGDNRERSERKELDAAWFPVAKVCFAFPEFAAQYPYDEGPFTGESKSISS
jgi:hypothetical protein